MKIIRVFVIIAFINLISGCYSHEFVKKAELEQAEDDILITTSYGTEYELSKGSYYIENDTLYTDNSKIALSSISKIESVWLDGVKTGLLVVGIVGFVAILGLALSNKSTSQPKCTPNGTARDLNFH